jgi:hypothetical protein
MKMDTCTAVAYRAIPITLDSGELLPVLVERCTWVPVHLATAGLFGVEGASACPRLLRTHEGRAPSQAGTPTRAADVMRLAMRLAMRRRLTASGMRIVSLAAAVG